MAGVLTTPPHTHNTQTIFCDTESSATYFRDNCEYETLNQIYIWPRNSNSSLHDNSDTTTDAFTLDAVRTSTRESPIHIAVIPFKISHLSKTAATAIVQPHSAQYSRHLRPPSDDHSQQKYRKHFTCPHS